MNNASKEPRLPLAVALHLYWRHLIGIAVFPTVSWLGFGYLHLPSLFFLPLFIAAAIHAEWPYWAKRAPYVYQFVSFLVWVGGCIAVVAFSRFVGLVQWLLFSHRP